MAVHGFDLDLSVNRAWTEFQARLADHISIMADGDVLAVESAVAAFDPAEGGAPCVQFLIWDNNMVRCEVPSNNFLHPKFALDDAGLQALVDLGWAPPSDNPEADNSSPAFCVDKRQSWADQLASMTVAAFRTVFGVQHPAFLSSDLTGNQQTPDFDPSITTVDAMPILDPTAAYTPHDVDHLKELVTLALIPMLGNLPERDGDGDIPIRVGSTVMFIGPLADSLDVQLFSPLVQDISNRTRAAEVIADLNRKWSRIKFVLIDDRLSVFLEVAGSPFVPKHLTDTCASLTSFLRSVDDEFAARIGGELFFANKNGEVGAPQPELTFEDLPPELETLLHLDLDVADDLEAVADVCGRDRDLILQLLHVSNEWQIQLRGQAADAQSRDDAEEAAGFSAQVTMWERMVDRLRGALRLTVLPNVKTDPPAKPQPEQMGLFADPSQQTLFDDPS
ncbi:hypothetical protein B2J88_17470 [Rhodococcus sp. SRB_17]|uniref:T3SS (YopN, CesT) and YbjN peptide-binding chaperone 1 n=1 Tax=Rhodococcus sp. OK302 TaxID=1882769 RepID=UPI000B93C570|nr:hypothetical protein [Rhodococcus sp. OK302]NMM86137.1 hypothetical protein [Rhodococcus sp. SRB_17]OYD71355.1 hypothetical protein BDB13_5021 [Rhodococcus sp. OK302]